eukprot:m.7989 g.7989  ORF g.7989 m.7989 type:complete len:56 (+) comp20245_c0_seq2:121-288(+)
MPVTSWLLKVQPGKLAGLLLGAEYFDPVTRRSISTLDIQKQSGYVLHAVKLTQYR